MDKKQLEEVLKKTSVLDVRHKIVLITQEEDVSEMLSDDSMYELAQVLKRAGAIEVVLTTPDVKFETLSDKDLADIGLKRIGTQGEETNGKTSSDSVETKGKARKRRKVQVTH